MKYRIPSRYWGTMAVYNRRCFIKENQPWSLRLVKPRHRMHVLTDEEFINYDDVYISRKMFRYVRQTASHEAEAYAWRLG